MAWLFNSIDSKSDNMIIAINGQIKNSLNFQKKCALRTPLLHFEVKLFNSFSASLAKNLAAGSNAAGSAVNNGW